MARFLLHLIKHHLTSLLHHFTPAAHFSHQNIKMVKQTKSKKPENLGKGNITPIQIAFIVDCYLSDNNYIQTRASFHSEASNLVSKFPSKEVPNSLMGLRAILDEYVWLKGQKMSLDQEKIRVEQENLRIQNLLKGMQSVMSAYDASANTNSNAFLLPPAPSSSLPTSSTIVPHPNSTSGYYPMYNTHLVTSSSGPSTSQSAHLYTTPVVNQGSTKRKSPNNVSTAPLPTKRSRRKVISDTVKKPINAIHNTQNPSIQNHDNTLNRSPIQGSNVAKCLFNQTVQSSPTNTSSPRTPPIASSSQTDKSTSPLANCSTVTSHNKDTTPQQFTSTNSTTMIFTSPAKKIYCSIERNHSVSTSSPAKMRPTQRDHVKGRLNFDTSDMPLSFEKPACDGVSTSESDRENELFDLDLENLDILGENFNFSDLLSDFDFQSEGLGYSNQIGEESSPDSSGSQDISGNVEMGNNDNQFVSQCSTMTEFHTEKDMNHTQDYSGPETVTTIKSITKCIKYSTPVKGQRD